MEQIKEIVQDVIGDMVQNKKDRYESILKVWSDVLGKKARNHTKIINVSKGKLLVNVDSSVWLFQLNLKRSQLLKKLKEAKVELEDISFRIGRT